MGLCPTKSSILLFSSREDWPLLSSKYFTFHPQRLSFGEFALTDFRHHWISERYKCFISYWGGGGTLGPIFPLTDWQNVDCLTEVDRPTQLICILISTNTNRKDNLVSFSAVGSSWNAAATELGVKRRISVEKISVAATEAGYQSSPNNGAVSQTGFQRCPKHAPDLTTNQSHIVLFSFQLP